MSTEPSNDSRVSQTKLARLRDSLSARDHDVLALLSQHRYASTGQIRRRFFHGHTTQDAATRATLRVLDRLLRHRLVARLERRVGGHPHGSAAFIWYLDAPGERLTRRAGASRRRYTDPTSPFLEHTLQITETVTVLHEIERDGGPAVTQLQVETEAWRSYHARPGVVRILKPDLFVALAGSDYDDHWYIEIDRGTESLPVLLTKSRAYAAYRHTGRAQAEHGVFPRVLWVLPTQRRVTSLNVAIRADPALPERLFTLITPDQLAATMRDAPDP